MDSSSGRQFHYTGSSKTERSTGRPKIYCSPHLCVGFLFLILYPAAFSSSSSSAASSAAASFTHNFVTYHLSHTSVTLGDIRLRFAWQASHLATSPFVLRGRRCTWRHLPSFHVSGVALGDIHLRFAWQA